MFVPTIAVPPAEVLLDRSGLFPTLTVCSGAGGGVSLNGRRNPVADARRHLDRALRGGDPETIVLIGLGLGYVLDAIEQSGLASSVLAFEPLPASLPHFFSRRDWSAWLETGRLRIVEGPDYPGAGQAWAALSPSSLPPVIVDPGLSNARPDLIPGARGAVARAQYGTPFDTRVTHVRQSMLHPKVLTLLEHAAATAKGAIVEIGAYVGGSTIAMARGVRDSGRDTPMFTVEPGGAHTGHPDLPSSDIFGDLVANLRGRGLERYVTLLRGFSSDPAILRGVEAALVERRMQIGLLCIDADGHVQRDLDLYLPMCAHGCVVVVDDYSGPPENIKAELTQPPVDALVASGRAQEIGVFGWGTWIGVYTPETAR